MLTELRSKRSRKISNRLNAEEEELKSLLNAQEEVSENGFW